MSTWRSSAKGWFVRNGLEVGRVNNVLEDDRVEVHGPLVSVCCQCVATHGWRQSMGGCLLFVVERQRAVGRRKSK